MKPLITIVIPNYNHGCYLKRAVLSALYQSYRPLEVIVVDDSSEDESLRILSSIKRDLESRPPASDRTDSGSTVHKSPRGSGSYRACHSLPSPDLRIITIPHGGLSAARNAGIKRARGQWITLLDSDDYLEKDAVELMYRQALSSGADMIQGSHYTCREPSAPGETAGTFLYASPENRRCKENRPPCRPRQRPSRKKPSRAGDRLLKDKESIHLYYLREGRGHTFAWARLYRAELLKVVPYPEGKDFEDIWTITGLCESTGVLRVINTPVYNYCLHKNTITDSPDIQRLFQGLEARLHNIKYYQRSGAAPGTIAWARAAAAEYCLFLMGRICRAGIRKNREDWNRALRVFRRQGPFLVKKSPAFAAAWLVFSISPVLLGQLCRLYSFIKNS